MSNNVDNKSTLTILTVFAVAMALLEAAVVVYMRPLLGMTLRGAREGASAEQRV